jgi:leucyl-tRNA synthetase
VILPVQVDGKVRFRIEVPPDASEEEARRLLTGHPEFARHLGEAVVERIIVVPGRAVSVVTRRQ